MNALDERGPRRDALGRILHGVTWESTPEEIDEAVARRDAEDRRSMAELRRMGRLF